MKIPKYIDKAISMRTKYALLLDKYCDIVDEFIDKYGIDASMEDYHGGVELYVHPTESEKYIREAILLHGGK